MPSSPEIIEVSFDKGGMELDELKEELAEEVGENKPLVVELVGHESDPGDEDLEMQDLDSELGEEDDDSSDPDYDSSRNR